MTKDKLISVLRLYSDTLTAEGIVGRELEEYDREAKDISVADHLAHVVWMCQAAIGQAEGDEVDKAMLWLGYIQGVLFMLATTPSERCDSTVARVRGSDGSHDRS